MSNLIHCELASDGVLLATIDMPGRTMNVFSTDLMDALDEVLDRVEADPAVRSVVITSAKSSFLAGADLEMVRGFTDSARTFSREQMSDLCGRLGRQFVRLEASPKPWVAAVNGIALGGGLELAMACRERVVTDDPRTQLGVPEVRWGLLPGAGGTQRLPRLAGFDSALELLLGGRPVDPATAVRLGIFARAVPSARLLDEARSVARTLQGQPYDARRKFPRLAQNDVPGTPDTTAEEVALRFGVSTDDFVHYPAYGAIIDSVLRGAWMPLSDATAEEMNQFLRLMFDPVAGCMIRSLFLDRLRAERELASQASGRIEQVNVGQISPERSAWAQALRRIKLPQAFESSLAADTLELVDHEGGRYRIDLRVLDEPAVDVTSTAMILAPDGPYGRVVEIVGSASQAIELAAALGAQLRSLAWRTPGPKSMLQRMRGLDLPGQVLLAGELPAAARDTKFVDVAACLSGVSPAWSGGPMTWQATQPRTASS
ncbi:MAG: hypothetical protein JWQ07_1099 [Ramlibacter sp.]|nr:hypothetical protein [Ramlibacter sp.]